MQPLYQPTARMVDVDIGFRNKLARLSLVGGVNDPHKGGNLGKFGCCSSFFFYRAFYPCAWGCGETFLGRHIYGYALIFTCIQTLIYFKPQETGCFLPRSNKV